MSEAGGVFVPSENAPQIVCSFVTSDCAVEGAEVQKSEVNTILNKILRYRHVTPIIVVPIINPKKAWYGIFKADTLVF